MKIKTLEKLLNCYKAEQNTVIEIHYKSTGETEVVEITTLTKINNQIHIMCEVD